jgi:hypothetical protein
MMTNSQEDLRLVYNNGINSLVNANFYVDGSGAIQPRTGANPPAGSKQLNRDQVKMVRDTGMINEREITQGYMRTEASILPNLQIFTFPIVTVQAQQGNNSLSPLMNLIAMQDSFLVNAMGYSLCSYAMTNGNVQNNTDWTANNDWSPITYVDAYHGNSPTVVMDEGNGMLWFGAYINITVNKHELVPKWDCQKHYFVGQTQTSTSQVPPFTLTKNQFDGGSSHYYAMQPNIIFGGMRDSVVKLNLPSNVPATIAPYNLAGGLSPWTYGTTSSSNLIYRLVLDFQGLLMQNSTSAR